MNRQEFLATCAAFGAMLATGSARAAGYPDKPVRIVVPYAPGGGGDVVGRPLAKYLTEHMGSSFFVDNRGGAGGNIGMELVAQSAPDGYTIILAQTAQLAINQSLYKKLRYDADQDFAPITLLGSAPYFLAVNPSVPAKNLAEFIALAKSKPGSMSYGSTGSGSGLHLSMELLKSMAGIDLVHVPYKGGGANVQDLVAGTLQAAFCSFGAASAQIRAGKIRVLAVSSSKRSGALPDVPTIAEAGVPGYDSGTWYTLLAPKGTPADVIKRLHDGAIEALRSSEVTERFGVDGVTPIGSTPAELSAYVKKERVKWAEVVRRSGARVD